MSSAETRRGDCKLCATSHFEERHRRDGVVTDFAGEPLV